MSDNKITDIQDKVKERTKQKEKPPEIDIDDITPEFVKGCFDLNLRGDGMLYAALNKKRVVFNKTAGQWFAWQGHHWALDENGAQAMNVVIEVAFKYETVLLPSLFEDLKKERAVENGNEKKKLDEISAVNKRIKGLNGDRAQKCLLWATIVDDGLSVKGEIFDCMPHLLAAQNGVVDLRSGKFRPGRHDDWLLKSIPHDLNSKDWEEDHVSEAWGQYLTTSLAPPVDHKYREKYIKEIISFIRRLLGYFITGYRTERIFPILIGDQGQNGKGVLIDLLYELFGQLAAPIPAEMLLKQKYSKNASAASPELMALKGLRIGCASETEEGRAWALSEIKRLVGGDKITARDNFDKYLTTFAPTHKLLVASNHLSKADSEDDGFWYRVAVIRFHWSFVAKPTRPGEIKRDPNLIDKLREEAPKIIGWIIRGCLEWQDRGLDMPSAVTDEVIKYRGDQDYIGEWINACCNTEDKTTKIKFRELYDDFEKWYKKEKGDFVISKIAFSAKLEKKGFIKEKSSQVYFYGIEPTPWIDRKSDD